MEDGAGADHIMGEAGDDTLTGGRGDDRLEGGDGTDTYIIDPGDGNDTIVDSDGQGAVQFDGNALQGGSVRDDGTFLSADGKAIYAFNGDSEDGGTLTIRFYDKVNPDNSATPTNVVQIKNWENGDLGIALGDGGSGALSAKARDGISPLSPEFVQPSLQGYMQTGDNFDAGSAIWNTNAASNTNGDSTAPLQASVATPTNDVIRQAQDVTSPTQDVTTSALDAPANSQFIQTTLSSEATVSTPTPDVITSNSPSKATEREQALNALLDSGSDTAANFASSLVTPEAMHAALKAFDGIAEAPDIGASVHATAQNPVGVTAQDVSSALMDFHDATMDFSHSIDQAIDHQTIEPDSQTLIATVATSNSAVTGRGIGQSPEVPRSTYLGSQPS